MTHPWLKKNPLMSLWLSGANTVAGSMRGHAAAQAKRQAATAKRQAAAAMTHATKDILNFSTCTIRKKSSIIKDYSLTARGSQHAQYHSQHQRGV
jgi:hypothetical protein